MSIEKKIAEYHVRARLPVFARAAAILGLVVGVLVIGIGFYWGSFRNEFRMKGLPAELSTEVIAKVNGYSRTESESGSMKYTISADTATTFDDRHQELKNVVLEVFDRSQKGVSDRISSRKAIYVPITDDGDDFRVFFAGDVVINARQGLKVKTEQLAYTNSNDTAVAEEKVDFSRDGMNGSAFGAVLRVSEKTLSLLKNVEITAVPTVEGDELSNAEIAGARIRSDNAFFDQNGGRITFNGNTVMFVRPETGNSRVAVPTTVRAAKAVAFVEDDAIRRVELTGDASVLQKSGGLSAEAEKITGYFEGDLERLELDGDVRIVTDGGGASGSGLDVRLGRSGADPAKRTRNGKGERVYINAAKAVYRSSKREILLTGNARVRRGEDLIGGGRIYATIYESGELRSAKVSEKALLRQVSAERTSVVEGSELSAEFESDGDVAALYARGRTRVRVTPKKGSEYKGYTVVVPGSVRIVYDGNGKPAGLQTKGRTSIELEADGTGTNPADKTLTADSVVTSFKKGTDELENAQARGNAILVIEPKAVSGRRYRTIVKAPSFECDFYGGNNARECNAPENPNARRIPLGDASRGSTQTLDADRMRARFDRGSQDISSLSAFGNARFAEGDRKGLAANVVYTESDRTVRLRGGSPVVWDSAARARALEIDWNVETDSSVFRRKVRATYYSQNKTSGAAPFSRVNSPVFVTSGRAEFDHKAKTARFSGDAKAWQEDNYVRADSLVLVQKDGRMMADGEVRSLLYESKTRIGDRTSTSPVYAQADKMSYNSARRVLRYEGRADIRQGSERLRAGSATVFLNKKNELLRTVVEVNVIITQPGRRATGDYAVYEAEKETVVLKGKPARISDKVNGSSEGSEVFIDLKNNSATGRGSTSRKGAGRIRSVYKIKNGKLN